MPRHTTSTSIEQEHAGYGEQEPDLRSGASQGGNTAPPGSQRFSNVTAQGASRFHAGNNSYVQHQNNYYAPAPPPVPERKSTLFGLKDALEFPGMHRRFASIETEFRGTCKWLKHTEEFKRWRDPAFHSVNHSVLWISGAPGAGKSTIMKHAYHEDMHPSARESIAFFFNAKGCALEQSSEGMFRALLCELLDERFSELWDSITRSEMQYYKEHGWPLALLKDLFRKAVRLLRFVRARPVVTYIDALDECAEDEVREMLTYFTDLGEESTSADVNLLVCFASRPYPNITIDCCESITLEKCPGHRDDIRSYVRSRLGVKYPGVTGPNHHREMISEIVERSSGVFLWVNIVVTRLRKSADHGDHPHLLRTRLLEIPATLHDLYDDMIDRDGSTEYLLPLVQWVLFAQGRLRGVDLCTAVIFSTNSIPTYQVMGDWTRSDDDWPRNFILTGSKGFLKITNKYMPCEFIHESVREYFLAGGLQKLDSSLGDNDIAKSHARLALSCQKYLDAYRDSPLFRFTDLEPSESDRQDAVDTMVPVPFLAYIRDKGAFLHAETAEWSGVSQAAFCANFDFDTWLELDLRYPRSGTEAIVESQAARAAAMRRHATRLHLLVDIQMESLVQRDLQIHASDDQLDLQEYLDAQCGNLGTALHLAVESNNTVIIRALITAGAHVDFRCEVLGTPLDYAMLLDRTESVQILLHHGATPASELSPHQRRKLILVRESSLSSSRPQATRP